jgi:hypothetical protein
MMGVSYKSVLFYCKTYPFSCCAFVLAILGCVSLIVAVSSPFWLVSRADSDSGFVRLGLWRVCFSRYQHANPDFQHILDGCYPLHRHKSEIMRNWLQPVWFIIVQCLVTSATFLSALCVCLLGYMMFQGEVEIKIFVAAFVFVFEAISAFIALLGVCIFAVMSFERSWIKYPKSNTLSWGFGFCVVSAALLSLTAGCLLIQTLKMRKVLSRDNRGSYHIPLSNRSMPY